MQPMEQASLHMSNARRHLIAAHRNGESHPLALAEVRLALAAIGPVPTEARDWVRRLRAAVEGDSIDAAQFMDAVDELASFLFFRDLATA
jgi:hypothetical protein